MSKPCVECGEDCLTKAPTPRAYMQLAREIKVQPTSLSAEDKYSDYVHMECYLGASIGRRRDMCEGLREDRHEMDNMCRRWLCGEGESTRQARR